jgi:hypothetical protein
MKRGLEGHHLTSCECVAPPKDFFGLDLAAERWSSHVNHPIAEVLGDYRAFFAGQKDRLLGRGIDISPYPLIHLAYRVGEYDRYLHHRALLERHATAMVETVWRAPDLEDPAARAAARRAEPGKANSPLSRPR